MNNKEIMKRVFKDIKEFVLNANNHRAEHDEYDVHKLSNGCMRGFGINNIVIDKAYNSIIKIPKYKYQFSRVDFKRILVNAMVKSYGMTVDDGAKNIMKIITHHYLEYSCVVPIYGLCIRHKIRLNGITLYPYNERNKFFDKCKYHTLCNDIHNKLGFATVQIEAGAPQMAIQLSMKIIGSITNAFTLIFSSYNNIYNIKPGTYLYPRRGNEILVMSSEESTLSPNQYFSSLWLILDDKKLKDNKIGFKYIKEIAYIQYKLIHHERLSEIENRFNNAGNLIAEGIRSRLNSTKMIKFISAMESVVEDRKLKTWGHRKDGTKKKFKVGISRQISNKIPEILSHMIINNHRFCHKKLINIKHELHRLYKIRSYMAHGNIIWVNNYDVQEAWRLSKLTLLNIFVQYILKDKDQSDVNKNLNKVFIND